MSPRIRTIKPEFFGDEKLAPLPALTRFVFLGLISMADDAGRLVDNVKSIDGFIFPDTDETSRESLDILASLSRVSRYTVASGQRIIQIVGWAKHQKVDRASTYVLPAETLARQSRDSRETLDESSRSDLRPTTPDHGPTIMDPRPPTRASAAVEWLTPYLDLWSAHVGGDLDPKDAARYLGPVREKHGDECLRRWGLYLAGTEVRYASPKRFRATFGQWDGTVKPKNGPRPLSKQEVGRQNLADAMARRARERGEVEEVTDGQ